MDPHAVIESYVDDVVRRLPRSQRADVGFELRSLLNEDLQGRAMEAGRAADDGLALDLLHAFGAPQIVAERYRPASFTIIPPSHSRAFALWSVLGVAIQWAVTLPPVFLQPQAYTGEAVTRLGVWWSSFGLGAFWLPGFIVTLAMVGAWIRHRWPAKGGWKPRVLDPDRVNQPALATGLLLWALGVAVWIALALAGDRLPGVLARIFAFDTDFLRWRAPWLLALWAGHYALYVVVFAAARWRPILRQIDMAFCAAFIALFLWFIAAGPIFTDKVADDSTKLALAILAVICLGIIAVRLLRQRRRSFSPKAVSSLGPS